MSSHEPRIGSRGRSCVIPAQPAPLKATTGFPARPFQFYRNFLKRFLDIALILLAVPVVLPVLLILALIIAVSGGRPFYSQTRIGYGGRSFRIWKLRTMVRDADSVLASYLEANPAAREEWEHTQKLRKDPRITRFGCILRRTSLDELPQLWNVLKGDMSLVGPRPMLPEQRALYPGRAYYRLRPGLTGPWQVSARNASGFAERAHYDEYYDQKLSLMTDIRLILKTVLVVMRATGC